MLSAQQQSDLTSIVDSSLDRCEELWSSTLGMRRLAKSIKEMAETKIPGHPYLGDNDYSSDDFIALVVDMRDSTKHLRQAISTKVAKVSQMQRVYYEVSALLPAMAKVIQDEHGIVTEYLGDGALALFQVPKEKDKRDQIVYCAHDAAVNCLEALKIVVNPALSARYQLPPLEIGIGLAFSSAIVTRFGLPPNTDVKVVGECVYFAAELSKERNQILVHSFLEHIWPTSERGRIRFQPRKVKDLDAYLLGHAEN